SYTTSAPSGSSAMVSARLPEPETLVRSTVPWVTAAVQLLIVVPSGASSATSTVTAASGPLLVTLMVTPTSSPGTYDACATSFSDLTVTRSASSSEMTISSDTSQPSGKVTSTLYVPGSVTTNSSPVPITTPSFFHSY